LSLSVCFFVFVTRPTAYSLIAVFTKLHTQVGTRLWKNILGFQDHGVIGRGHHRGNLMNSIDPEPTEMIFDQTYTNS